MQKQLNHAGDKIRELNEKDMAKQITMLKDTLEHAGYPGEKASSIPAADLYCGKYVAVVYDHEWFVGIIEDISLLSLLDEI